MKRSLRAVLVWMVFVATAGSHPGSGIAVDAQGRVFIAAGAHIVRFDTNGQSQVIVSDPRNEKFFQLHHIRRAPDGGMVTASDRGDGIWRFTSEGKLSRFYPPPNEDRALRVGSGGDPFEVDAEGSVYAINSGQFRFTQIFRISPRGRISFVAGGAWGHGDGTGAQAKFADVHGGSLAMGPDGVLYLTDDRLYLRKISRDGVVTTVAGGAPGGFADGQGQQARFDNPMGLAVERNGNIFVADSGNHRVRKLTQDGLVSTVAGSGARGGMDGPAQTASFTEPTGVAIGPDDNLYVLEVEKLRVRKISPEGIVTTIGRAALGPATR